MTLRKTAALCASLVVLAAACGDDNTLATTSPTETTSPAATTATTAPPATQPPATTSTTVAPTTAPTTTTTTTAASTTTTTTVPFNGTTATQQGPMNGTPDGRLVDVRVGAHPGFTRVVWEMDGNLGTPLYIVAYEPGPFENMAGPVAAPAGNAFLKVIFTPGIRWDLTDPGNIIRTYLGSELITVNSGSVREVMFLEDFEANMEWIIGLTGQKPFHAFTMENPTRLVIDISD